MRMHEKYMRLAIEEAKKGEGFANPNPLVGAVIVKKNKILGIGYHKKYGENQTIYQNLNTQKKTVFWMAWTSLILMWNFSRLRK